MTSRHCEPRASDNAIDGGCGRGRAFHRLGWCLHADSGRSAGV